VRVELTPAGDALFRRLDEAAVGLDGRLRAGLSDEEIGGFRDVMRRLLENVGA
jgi:DNA-binding MarR family transcriptional regulator